MKKELFEERRFEGIKTSWLFGGKEWSFG